jgi:thiamine pyrophosphate-dependent acetolactate synthase large subunit-like protein
MNASSARAVRLAPENFARPWLAEDRRPNVATAALAQLRDAVHPLVPTVAGGNDMPLLEAAYALSYQPISTRSELGAGFLANGIAWESGRPTLCLVIT